MQANIHPDYHALHVVCSCGNKFDTKSTYSNTKAAKGKKKAEATSEKQELHVEICSACHPFYTGQQKIMDTRGRVENFMRRYKTSIISETEK